MTSLKKKLRLRRLRREQEERRFMAELCRWVTAAERFDESIDRPDVELTAIYALPLKTPYTSKH